MADELQPSGISRRDMVKRAAIAGGVIAWTAPTLQVLGTGRAFAQSVSSGATPCADKGAKIGTLTLQWVGGLCSIYGITASNPTNNSPTADCTDNTDDLCPPCSNCECEDTPGCGSGTVWIRMSDGATVTSQSDVFGGGTWISSTVVTGPLNFSFTFQNTDNMPMFELSTTSDFASICQTLVFHTSCSKSPPANGPVRPDYQLGGLLVTAWTVGSKDDAKDKDK
jgi:hypothetical protein